MDISNSRSPGVPPYSECIRNRPCPHLQSPVPFEGDVQGHSDKYSGRLCTTPTTPATHCYMPHPLQGHNPYFLINNGETMQVGKDHNWAVPSPVENKSCSTSPWYYDTAVVQGNVSSFYNLGYQTVPQSWTHGFVKSSVGMSNEHGILQTDLADPIMVMDQEYCGPVRPVTPHTSNGIQQPQDSRISSTSEVSPFKALPPVTDLLSVLRCSPSLWQLERTSPSDSASQETLNTYTPVKHNMPARHSRTCNQEVKAELEDETSGVQVPLEHTMKFNQIWDGTQAAEKPKQLSASKMLADRQRRQQREREHAIKRSLDELCKLLPWGQEERRPTKNSILLKAIHYIEELKTNLEKARVRQHVLDKGHTGTVITETETNDKPSSNAMEKCTDDDTSVGGNELSLPEAQPVKQEVDSVDEESCNAYSEDSYSSRDSISADPQPMPSSPYVKRPMNAFMIFSQEHRKLFKEMFPTQDNRKISASLADHWHRLRDDQKQPYRDKAKELMRQTKENYPDYKYYDSSKRRQPGGLVVGTSSPSKTTTKSKNQPCNTDDFEDRQQSAPIGDSGDDGVNDDGDDTVQHEMLADDATDISPSYETRPLPVASMLSCKFGPLLPQFNQVADHEQGMYQRSCNKSVDNWIQCDGCGSWRLLPDFISLSNLPEEWYCCRTCSDRPAQQNNSAIGLEKDTSEVTKRCNTMAAAGPGLRKCRRTYGMDQKNQWCRNCQHKKKCEVGKKVCQ